MEYYKEITVCVQDHPYRDGIEITAFIYKYQCFMCLRKIKSNKVYLYMFKASINKLDL